jgi:hypothetical protein
MTTRIVALIVAGLVGVLQVQLAQATPRIEKIELKPYTKYVVYIPRSMGTKFIFPFIIDDDRAGKDFPPFTKLITNPGFASERAENLNSFIVFAPADKLVAGARGNLFFNVAGYEITVELIVTDDTSKHVSDVYFQLGKEKREQLIQEAVAQRMKRYEAEYKERQANLDAEVDRLALARVGTLALSDPSTERVKEETRGTLKNGDAVTLYVDSVVNYGVYTVIPFEINLDSRNAGAPFRGAKLFSYNRDTKQTRALGGGSNLPANIEPNRDVKGALTVLTKEINPKEQLKLVVQVDDTNLEVLW